ncbi:hypothetical protein C2E23DRAFT_859895 [Lenzites betulinus]|nr:hypothetical protein C2E23DRAFT_859895 [Lenzites betulinus]
MYVRLLQPGLAEGGGIVVSGGESTKEIAARMMELRAVLKPGVTAVGVDSARIGLEVAPDVFVNNGLTSPIDSGRSLRVEQLLFAAIPPGGAGQVLPVQGELFESSRIALDISGLYAYQTACSANENPGRDG